MTMQIGIDFDNTIIDYNDLLISMVKERHWLSDINLKSKKQIKDSLHRQPDGITKWKTLQTLLYGELIEKAKIMKGILPFLEKCLRNKISVFIISHKTHYAEMNPEIDLRQAALSWLKSNRFFNPDLTNLHRGSIYFENTQKDKVKRIKKLKCTHFIDDLEEVLSHPEFPADVKRYHLSKDTVNHNNKLFLSFSNWKEIENAIFK